MKIPWIFLVSVIVCVIVVSSASTRPAFATFRSIRAGARPKKPSIILMIKSFWLSLVDPKNEEILKQSHKKANSPSGKGNIISTKRGRSLKD